MEIGHCATGIRLDCHQFWADPIQRGEADRTSDDTVDQIADRQAPCVRIAADAALDQRVDRGAEIGAKHQREGGMRRNHALVANVMLNSTTATLECAAQVSAAASRISIKGSVVTTPS